MSPSKKTVHSRVKQYQDEGMEVNGNAMVCKCCNKTVEWSKSDTVKKHIGAESHKKAKETYNSKKRGHQRTLEESVSTSKKRKEDKHQFILDTVDAFLSANIPVFKLDNTVSI